MTSWWFQPHIRQNLNLSQVSGWKLKKSLKFHHPDDVVSLYQIVFGTPAVFCRCHRSLEVVPCTMTDWASLGFRCKARSKMRGNTEKCNQTSILSSNNIQHMLVVAKQRSLLIQHICGCKIFEDRDFSMGINAVVTSMRRKGHNPRNSCDFLSVLCNQWTLVSPDLLMLNLAQSQGLWTSTVDGSTRNPERNQLRLGVFPTIYRVKGTIPGGDRRISEPSTVWTANC